MDIQQWLEEAEISIQPDSPGRRPRAPKETDSGSLSVQLNTGYTRNPRHSSPIDPLRLDREVSSRVSCNASLSTSSCLSESVVSHTARLTPRPSETFGRRPRHKTRVEKYRLSHKRRRTDNSSPARKPSRNAAEDRPKRSKKKRNEVSKPLAGLVQTFRARNVSRKRITLDSSKKGFYNQGRASAPTKSQGRRRIGSKPLPLIVLTDVVGDLVFSELGFLRNAAHAKQARSCQIPERSITPERARENRAQKANKHARHRDHNIPRDEVMTTYFEAGHARDDKSRLEAGNSTESAHRRCSPSSTGRLSMKESLGMPEEAFPGHRSRGGPPMVADGRPRHRASNHGPPPAHSPRTHTSGIGVEHVNAGDETQAARPDNSFGQTTHHKPNSNEVVISLAALEREKSHGEEHRVCNGGEGSPRMNRISSGVPESPRAGVKDSPSTMHAPGVCIEEPARPCEEESSRIDADRLANHDTCRVSQRDSSTSAPVSASSLSRALDSASWSLSRLLKRCDAPELTNESRDPFPLQSPMVRQHQCMTAPARVVVSDPIIPNLYLQQQYATIAGATGGQALSDTDEDCSAAVCGCLPNGYDIGDTHESADCMIHGYESSIGQSIASSQWLREQDDDEFDGSSTRMVDDPGQNELQSEPEGFWQPNLLY